MYSIYSICIEYMLIPSALKYLTDFELRNRDQRTGDGAPTTYALEGHLLIFPKEQGFAKAAAHGFMIAVRLVCP